MTTKFGSFNASAMNAFEESRLSARNKAVRIGSQVIVMVFIDESSNYTGPLGENFWQHDRRVWNSRRAFLEEVRGIFVFGVVVHISSREADSIYAPITPPDDDVLPDGFKRFRLPRSAAATATATMLDLFDLFRDEGSFLLWGFGSAVDDSGSMDVSTIQPAYSEFLDILETSGRFVHGFGRVSFLYENERWVDAGSKAANRVLLTYPAPGD